MAKQYEDDVSRMFDELNEIPDIPANQAERDSLQRKQISCQVKSVNLRRRALNEENREGGNCRHNCCPKECAEIFEKLAKVCKKLRRLERDLYLAEPNENPRNKEQRDILIDWSKRKLHCYSAQLCNARAAWVGERGVDDAEEEAAEQ